MSWAVQLEGRFKPYDDVVSNTIEAAHERGESTVIVQIRGQKYIIGFADMKQKLARAIQPASVRSSEKRFQLRRRHRRPPCRHLLRPPKAVPRFA